MVILGTLPEVVVLVPGLELVFLLGLVLEPEHVPELARVHVLVRAHGLEQQLLPTHSVATLGVSLVLRLQHREG